MKTSIYHIKNRGFLFITTTVIILILLFNILIGYRIIFRKGERIEQLASKVKIEDLKYSLENLAYSELRRIDKAVNDGEVESGAEYIGYCDGIERVWFGNSESREGIRGYSLVAMKINEKKQIYSYKEGERVDFKTRIRMELLSVGIQENIIGVELEKILINEETQEKIYFKATVNLYYSAGNRNPATPNKEVLKNFEVGLKK